MAAAVAESGRRRKVPENTESIRWAFIRFPLPESTNDRKRWRVSFEQKFELAVNFNSY
jgi:hypothetical protein